MYRIITTETIRNRAFDNLKDALRYFRKLKVYRFIKMELYEDDEETTLFQVSHLGKYRHQRMIQGRIQRRWYTGSRVATSNTEHYKISSARRELKNRPNGNIPTEELSLSTQLELA